MIVAGRLRESCPRGTESSHFSAQVVETQCKLLKSRWRPLGGCQAKLFPEDEDFLGCRTDRRRRGVSGSANGILGDDLPPILQPREPRIIWTYNISLHYCTYNRCKVKILVDLSYSGLSRDPFFAGVKLVALAIFHQFQRDGMHYCGVGLRGRAEDIVVGHVHDDELAVGGEAKAVFSRR